MQPMVNTSPGASFLLRKKNTWYSVSDGNWSEPNRWISNGKKRGLRSPQAGDDVYINHEITLDTNNATVAGLFGFGKLIFGTVARNFTVKERLDLAGTIDMNDAAHNLYLSGYENSIGEFLSGTSGTVIYSSISLCQTIMGITYQNLTIACAGTAILIGDTAINGNLNLQANRPTNAGGILELSVFNFVVYGTSNIAQPSRLSKNSNIGSTLFVGYVNATGGEAARFSFTGNPDIEFRGGLDLNQHSSRADLGNGTMSFTTNNQNLNSKSLFQFGANIYIDSDVTLNITGEGIYCYGQINGGNSSSTLNNNSQLFLSNPSLPMSIGTFNYKNLPNTMLGICFDGDVPLPYTLFESLAISGSGIKTLSGDTTITSNLVLENSGKLECSSYSLSVDGTSSLKQPSLFSKNSDIGYILFGGQVAMTGGDAKRIDLSGNVNVEFRNGLQINQAGNLNNFGTGRLLFTTNDQTLTQLSGIALITANIQIVSITLTITSTPGNDNSFDLKGTLNGYDLNSIMINNGILLYENQEEPMQIGKLFCNIYPNTFIYGAPGDQNIQLPSDTLNPGYYNLTIDGSGVKTLLGNISVKNIYLLAGTAEVNLDGYSIANP